MEKMFSSSPQDPEVVNDPPPPYSFPEEFAEAGIKEDEMLILRDYDTVMIVDDSGSMEPLWNQVRRIPQIPDRTDCRFLPSSVVGMQGIGDARGGRLKIRQERD